MARSYSARPRTEQARDERRAQLLAAAAAALATQPYASLTMASLAQQLGLAKGTLYLYFPTKEALFLALLERELDTWFDSLLPTLSQVSGKDRVGTTAQLIADSLLQRPLLRQLLSLAQPVLEQDLSVELAHAFKEGLLRRLTQAGSALAQALDRPAPEAMRLWLRVHAMLIGLQSMAQTSPAVAEALADPALAALRVDLEVELAPALRGVLG